MFAGCALTVLFFLGRSEIQKRYSSKSTASSGVQRQIVQNIDDVNSLLVFADETLKDVTTNMQEIRDVLVKADKKTYLNSEERRTVFRLADDSLLLIESALYNTVPVFYNQEGESHAVFPVIIDASLPSYKITISSDNFNRKVFGTFLENLTLQNGLDNNVKELDKILSNISLERAQLGAYQDRLAYSRKTAAALLINARIERENEINAVGKEIREKQLALCVQSSSGIYCAEDRRQIQVDFDEVSKELNRIEVLLNKKPAGKHVCLLSQPEAENAMLYLSKKL